MLIADTSPFNLSFWLEDPASPVDSGEGSTFGIPALTADGQLITAQVNLTLSVVADNADLLLRLLRGRQSISASNIARSIKDELLAKVIALELSKHSASELRGSEALLRSIYESIRVQLDSTLSGYGLRLVNFFIAWGLSHDEREKIEEQRHQARLRAAQRQKELEEIAASGQRPPERPPGPPEPTPVSGIPLPWVFRFLVAVGVLMAVPVILVVLLVGPSETGGTGPLDSATPKPPVVATPTDTATPRPTVIPTPVPVPPTVAAVVPTDTPTPIQTVTPVPVVAVAPTVTISPPTATAVPPTPTLTATPTLPPTPTTVSFPDPGLDAVIREALGKLPGEEITAAELVGLTELEATDRAIADLTGIEYCVNLTILYLSWNQISDISPLSNLTSLNYLFLRDNQISDVSPLSNLTSLSTLYLFWNQISDISPLSNLTSLTELRLYFNQNAR